MTKTFQEMSMELELVDKKAKNPLTLGEISACFAV